MHFLIFKDTICHHLLYFFRNTDVHIYLLKSCCFILPTNEVRPSAIEFVNVTTFNLNKNLLKLTNVCKTSVLYVGN